MGSSDSLGTIVTSQDLESICSGSSDLGLTGSGPQPKGGGNKKNLSSKLYGSSPLTEDKMCKDHSSSQVPVSEENLHEREGEDQALARGREEKMVKGKCKRNADNAKFKRKFSCVSSSQPICGTESDLGKTTNWEFEWKKQVQIAKKMRLRAERAEDKLKQVRALLQKAIGYVKK